MADAVLKQDQDLGSSRSIVHVLESRIPGAVPRATINTDTLNLIAKSLSIIVQYAMGILYAPMVEKGAGVERYRGGDQYQQDGKFDDSRFELVIGSSDVGGFSEHWKLEVVE